MKRLCTCLIAAVLFLLSASPASAMFVPPNQVPVDRLITNITSYIKEYPDDARGYYELARVHYLAYVLKSDIVGAFEPNKRNKDKFLHPADDYFQYFLKKELEFERAEASKHAPVAPTSPPTDKPKTPAPPPIPTQEQLTAHVTESIKYFHLAIVKDKSQELFHLGLASLYEQCIDVSDEVAPWYPLPQEFSNVTAAPPSKTVEALLAKLTSGSDAEKADAAQTLTALITPRTWRSVKDQLASESPQARQAMKPVWAALYRQQAINHYWDAFEASVQQDSQITIRSRMGLEKIVSYEAGTAYKRLTGLRPLQKDEPARILQIDKLLKKIDGLPYEGLITPIIFNIQTPLPLNALKNDKLHVPFNLNGRSPGTLWSWVQPTTSILVWDPNQTGNITSGHQLFGSVTFNIFWENGYRAMDALDDNRDGLLTGGELTGLSIWQDLNANGVSDPGEVTPIHQTTIKSLRTHESDSNSPVPMHPLGLQLQSGQWLPTYDWLSHPAPAK